MSEVNYNPDVLTCLSNLSNDEVFTPPEIANAMLDMLPQELFSNPNAKFLDPACKTGVFLREIAKRLIRGQIPSYDQKIAEIRRKDSYGIAYSKEDRQFLENLQKVLDHIYHEQLYAIAITELTALVSRRSTYCSKRADSFYSISKFNTPDGNIRYQRTEHIWDGIGKRSGQKCIVCGASRGQFDRGKELETHAYEFIHVEDIYKMKFDLIISNPPYQMEDGGNGASATPIYQKFVQQAKKLKPKYLTMITPSRWFTGGKGLDDYRKEMLNDRHIKKIVDFQNAKDCFPGVSIGGGVSYFLWDRNYEGECEITNISNKKKTTLIRPLNEFPIFVRSNSALGIIKKISKFNEKSISSLIGTRNPYGLDTKTRGTSTNEENCFLLHTSSGSCYIPKSIVSSGNDSANKWKTMISCICSEHAGEPDKDGMYKVLSTIKILGPNEVCTDSYLVCNISNSKAEEINFCNYLKTKFARFLIIVVLSSIHITSKTMSLIPIQDFTKLWSDEELYRKYHLTDEEITLIESMIKPMDMSGGSDE